MTALSDPEAGGFTTRLLTARHPLRARPYKVTATRALRNRALQLLY